MTFVRENYIILLYLKYINDFVKKKKPLKSTNKILVEKQAINRVGLLLINQSTNSSFMMVFFFSIFEMIQ